MFQLNRSSSPGPDLIHPRVLKEAAKQLAKSISLIFRKSIGTGCLPDDWKLGHVPIFKKGVRHNPENHRPISLTSIPCKILESVIKDHVLYYLENHELLSRDQHGFRPKRSCILQLLEVFNEWSINLTGRSQRVVVRGCHSAWAPVLSGVPQGSVLGPVLFILYINDLSDSVQSSIKIFADDTKINRTVCGNSGHELLQQGLDAVVEWSKLWQLPFNESKRKSMQAQATQVTGTPCRHAGPQYRDSN